MDESLDWVVRAAAAVLALVFGVIVYILLVAAPAEKAKREEFAQQCYEKNGVYLKTTTGNSKSKRYEYVCVKKEIVLD